MNRCFYCGKKIMPQNLLYYNLEKDRTVFVCSFEHLKKVTAYIEFLQEYYKMFTRVGFVSLFIYLAFFVFSPKSWLKWIYLIFTLDWGIGCFFYPFLWSSISNFIPLYYVTILHRVFSVSLIFSGFIVLIIFF
ncbi:MAG: hypothetical protein AB1765_07490 [Candidatus Hydrogenedentota bacterium]